MSGLSPEERDTLDEAINAPAPRDATARRDLSLLELLDDLDEAG